MNRISSLEENTDIQGAWQHQKNWRSLSFLKPWLPFIIFLCIQILWHSVLHLWWGDDVWFKNYISSQNLPYPISVFSAIGTRWEVWTSRVFIESVIYTFSLLPSFCWKIADVAIWCLMYESIRRLMKIHRGSLQDVFLVFLLLTYPFSLMSEAGWFATSINYSWTLALGLFVICAARDMLTTKYSLPLFLLICVALLFSANQELMCVVLIASFAILLAVSYLHFGIYKKHGGASAKTSRNYLWILLGLSLAMLMVIFVCPGNAARAVAEATAWAPQFATMELLSKLHWGFIHAAGYFITSPCFAAICLLAVTVWLVFLQYKSGFFIKALLLLAALFYFGTTLSSDLFPGLSWFFGSLLEPGAQGYEELPDIIHSVVAALFFLCYGIVIVWLATKNKNCLVALIVLMIGFMTAGAMSFSPTVFASGARTLIIAYFSLIIATLYLIKDIRINKSLSTLIGWSCWFIIGLSALSQAIILWNTHL